MRERLKRLLTLQVIVVSFVTLLLVVSSATIIAYNHKSHEEATLDLFQQLSDQVSEKVIHRTSAYLKPARVATELVSDQVQHHPELLIEDSEELMQFMASILRVHPQLSSTYVGDSAGTLFQIRREWITPEDGGSPTEIYIRRRIDRKPLMHEALIEDDVGSLAKAALGEGHEVSPTYTFLQKSADIEATLSEQGSMPMVAPVNGQIVGLKTVGDDPSTRAIELPGVKVLWLQDRYRVGFISRSETVLTPADWLERTSSTISRVIDMIGEAHDEVNVIEDLKEIKDLRDIDDAEVNTLPNYVNLTDYDPRERIWYTLAERTRTEVWTPPYVFHRGSEPGLSAARPIFDGEGRMIAAASSDITLDKISEFLRSQSLGAGSKVLLVNSQGQVIGHPDTELVEHEDQSLDLPRMSSVNAVTQAAWSIMQTGTTGRSMLTVDGERVLVSFVPLPDRFGTDWNVVILVPEDALMGRAKEIQRNSLLISWLIVTVSMLLVSIFSRRISGPINRLSEQVESVRHFHLNNDFSTRSGIWEVQNMAQALHSMQAGLQSFSRYVPSNLVRQLVDSGEVARLGGERKQLAILFSDVANFTTMAEEVEAEFLMQHLSEYLEVVSQVLTEEGATIDKYIGDAVMAFWGAPNDDARPTERACISALRCQSAIQTMNTEWIQEGKPALPTRFGVHVGTTVVGNIGSSDRMNYTVIGDSVNLAARLEAVNKLYGTWIMISESVLDEVGSLFWSRPVDIVAVKGKTQGVGIHELIGTRSGDLEASSEEIHMCRETKRAFDLYLERRWEEALLVLEPLSIQRPEDRVVDLQIQRCRAFMVEPPPNDWSGLTVLSKK